MTQFKAKVTRHALPILVLTLLFFACQDGTISVADAAEQLDLYGDPLPDGALSRLGTVRYRHNGWHKRITFLADNETLVVGTENNTVRLWNANAGKMLRSIDLGGTRLQAFAVARHGKHLATISGIFEPVTRQFIGALNVWDVTTWKEMMSTPFVEPVANSTVRMAISPDGTTVVTGTPNGKLRFLDVPSKQESLSYETEYKGIQSINFSPDGELIAIATQREVVLGPWRFRDQLIRLPNLPRSGQVAIFSPDGKQLAVGAMHADAAQIYEVPSGKPIRRLRGKGVQYYREGLSFLQSENQLIVPANHINTLEFFDLANGSVTRTLDTGGVAPRDVAVTKNGRLAAMIGSEAEIKVWNLDSGEVISDRFIGHAETPYEIVFLPDAKRIATGAVDGTVRIWDIATGEHEQVLRHEGRWISALAVSQNGERILSSGFDDTVRLWDYQTGKEIFRLAGHGRLGGNQNYDVAFSPDGKTFLSVGRDLNLRRWDARTGKAIAEHAIRPSGVTIKMGADGKPVDNDPFGALGDRNSESVTAARFSADGKHLFAMVSQKKLCCIDVVTAKENYQIELSQPVDEFAFSHDDALLATVQTQRQSVQNSTVGRSPRKSDVTLLRVPTFDTVWKMDLSGGYSGDLRFSSDGKLLAVCLYGESPTTKSESWIEILSLDSGKPAYRIEGFDQDSNNVAFSPDGRYLAASYEDSSVLIWELEKFRVK